MKVDWNTLLHFKRFYIVLLLYIVLIGYMILLVIGGYGIFQLFQKYRDSEKRVAQMRSTVERVQNNKDILETSIDEYNQSLDMLIPDTETYFAVVASLEKLVSKTGITLSSYNLDVNQTNEKKLTLQVQVEGNQQQLRTFLETYLYAGGRIITCDQFSLSDVQKGKGQLLLTFYHDQEPESNAAPVGKISPNQIRIIQRIHDMME
jgi:Tfp pilus assembly protein PilO